MYFNLLSKIKNAQAAGKRTLKAPFTKMDYEIANILVQSKFLTAIEKKGRGPKRILFVTLNNPEDHVQGVKLISVPSRRMYVGYKDLKIVRQGFGVSVLSTSKGIMTSKDARKNKLGGELLFEIW